MVCRSTTFWRKKTFCTFKCILLCSSLPSTCHRWQRPWAWSNLSGQSINMDESKLEPIIYGLWFENIWKIRYCWLIHTSLNTKSEGKGSSWDPRWVHESCSFNIKATVREIGSNCITGYIVSCEYITNRLQVWLSCKCNVFPNKGGENTKGVTHTSPAVRGYVILADCGLNSTLWFVSF